MAFAKITRPTSIATLLRPRLFRWLDHAGKKTVTWIWAPPGAGKTTLVASYLATRKLRTIWYQIDEGDNDIATFFYYLGQAAPKRKRSLPLFTPEYQMGLPIFSRNFFRELFNRLNTPFALVFDNYQDVSADSKLHEVMQTASAEIPQGERVIFISRLEPPPVFARLHAQRTVEILDWPQLRFTQTEVNGLIRKLAPGQCSKDSINRLQTTSDGWAAGVVLSLEQLRSRDETFEKPNPPSSQVLFDYFAGEIFKKADPVTQDVLLQTAFVPKVTASTAEKLTGKLDAGQILANLHRQNYFTNRLRGSESAYEYHPLFREFLLSQAGKTYLPARIAEIRRVAAGLVESGGQVDAAADLLRDAEDSEGLAQLICRHAPTLLAQGRAQTVEQWLEAIPETMFAENPWLLYWRGMCRLGYRYKDCRRDCEQALTAFRRRGDAAGMFLAWAVLITSCQLAGDARAMDPWISLLDELMKEAPEFPSEEIETRVAAAMLIAIMLRKPNHPDGPRWAERALELARKQKDPFLKATITVNWSGYYWELGNIPKASLVIDEMRSLMRDRDVSPSIAMTAGIGVVWHEALAALPSYKRTVSEMLEESQRTGFEAAKYNALMAGIIGALSDGDLETGDPWLRELVKNVEARSHSFTFFAYWAIVWEALIRNDFLRAASNQPEMLRLGISDGWSVNNVVAYLMSAHVLAMQGKEEEARIHLQQALEIARITSSPYFEFIARLTEAQLCFHKGQEADGMRALKIAMMLGRELGFINSPVWIPALMAKLCAKALEANIEVEYVQGLIRKRKLVPKEAPSEIEAWPWPVKIYTLGQFQVLKDAQPLSFSHKVQRKPLALLKAVIALGGKGVREDVLTDSLWPDADGDAARFALTSAIHRLRKLLGHEQAIIRKDNEITLDDRYCWIDTWAVERLVARTETALTSNGDAHSWEQATELIQRAVALYRGPFLGNDPEAPWAVTLADRVRRRLLRQLKLIGQRYEEKEQLQQAVDLYEEALRVDTCAEDVCRRLMILYHQLGRPSEVASIYRQCSEALNRQFGINLSAETEQLVKNLRLSFASQSAVGK